MGNKEFNIESEIRLEEQLTELAEKYGTENVKNTLLKLIPTLVAEKIEGSIATKQIATQHEVPKKDNVTPRHETGSVSVDKQEVKKHLRPNIKDFNGFVLGLHEIQESGKSDISKPIVDYLNSFLTNAKLILDGKHKEVSESFYMDLASRLDFDLKNEDEEWIIFNLDIIKKQLKAKLRRIGYEFLDNDVEVGQLFNPKMHNCVKYIPTDEKYKDNRIIRVIDEGIIIEGIIHINANVTVGKYH